MDSAVNTYYYKQVPDAAIERGAHRQFVGGLWDELGELQLSFLKNQGLLPQHQLLDIGCGCLRGGLRFIDYLEQGHYFGLDINPSLLKAAVYELEQAGLQNKRPTLLHDEHFAFDRFGVQFDYLVAISVFTHLSMNNIGKCLKRAASVLKAGGALYATYFPAPNSLYLEDIQHQPGGITTYYDKDPFHNAFDEYQWLADQAGLHVELLGEWGHPRAQQMLRFIQLNGTQSC